MDDQHSGGGLPPDETPHVVYPGDPESALHPDIDPPAPRALVSGGGTRTPPPPPSGDDEDDEDSGMLRMSFMEHLEELRARLIKALIGFGVWLAISIADLRRTQDCILYGRRDCAVMPQPSK